MRLDEFHREAKCHAILYQQNPEGYRWRLFWFALFGVFCPIFLAAVFLGLAILASCFLYRMGMKGTFSEPLAIVAVIGFTVAGGVIWAQWIRLPKPEGHIVRNPEAPELFQIIQEVRQQLDAPTIHTVYLSNDFNMSVSQHPRFGLFGPRRNYLIVGLWALEAFSVEEIRSVIAHELGHLSRKHGYFNCWMYRLWVFWERLTKIDEQNFRNKFHHAGLFRWFFTWYEPHLLARTMVLQKAHELEADRFGMELSDRRTVLRQYLRFGVAATALEEVFWPGYFHEAHDEPLPPKDSFKRVVRFLGALDDRNLLDAVKKALSKISLPYETHPSLRERLISLGYEIPEPEEVLAILSEGKETETRRASTLLTESCLAHYRDHYNRALKAVHIAEWRMRHQEAKKARGKYELLDTKKIDDTLSESDYWDWAHYRYRYIDKEQSCFAIYEFLQHFPNHAQANYILGEKELRQNKAEGVAFIEKALENDSDAMMPGLLLLAKFYEQRGDEKSLVRIMERKDQHLLSQKAANTERSKLRAGDEFSEADLSKTDKEDIRKVLSYYPELTEAYLVRKRVTHLADKPCYVLAVRFKKRSLELDMEREQIQLNCLANDLPPTIPIYVFAVNRLPSSVVNKIKNIDGAMIHITQVEKAN